MGGRRGVRRARRGAVEPRSEVQQHIRHDVRVSKVRADARRHREPGQRVRVHRQHEPAAARDRRAGDRGPGGELRRADLRHFRLLCRRHVAPRHQPLQQSDARAGAARQSSGVESRERCVLAIAVPLRLARRTGVGHSRPVPAQARRRRRVPAQPPRRHHQRRPHRAGGRQLLHDRAHVRGSQSPKTQREHDRLNSHQSHCEDGSGPDECRQFARRMGWRHRLRTQPGRQAAHQPHHHGRGVRRASRDARRQSQRLPRHLGGVAHLI